MAVTVAPLEADLQISKSGNPDPVIAGQSLTYTLVITNQGPADANSLTITDTLPGGVSLASAAGCSRRSRPNP